MLAGLITGTGSCTNPGRGAILGQANPGTYAITKQYKFGTGARWEGNHRSGVALAMRHR